MKIGIAITTFKRPKTLKLALKQFDKHTPKMEGVEFVGHVQHFYPGKHKSIAEVKNLCLKALMEQECDYLYLFDDDCFTVHDDWWKPFIEAHLRTGQHHFLYLLDDSEKLPYYLARRKTGEQDGVSIFSNAQSCCLFFTRYAVLAVGGFDEAFGTYGYEHEQYSLRIHQSGMNTFGPFISVPGIEYYIYSLDVQGGGKFAAQLGAEFDAKLNRPKATLSLSKMQASLAANKQIFEKAVPVFMPIKYD
jgi:hypothetical protein